jgi:hypothetical protein
MLITEQSLAETLDGRGGDPRRRCRLFIPHQAVFIPEQLLFIQRSVFSYALAVVAAPASRPPERTGSPWNASQIGLVRPPRRGRLGWSPASSAAYPPKRRRVLPEPRRRR